MPMIDSGTEIAELIIDPSPLRSSCCFQALCNSHDSTPRSLHYESQLIWMGPLFPSTWDDRGVRNRNLQRLCPWTFSLHKIIVVSSSVDLSLLLDVLWVYNCLSSNVISTALHRDMRIALVRTHIRFLKRDAPGP